MALLLTIVELAEEVDTTDDLNWLPGTFLL